MIIETFEVGPLACNCTILADPQSGHALVIDPGDDATQILDRLRALDLTLDAMISTHAHIDHVGAVGDLQRATGALASIHQSDLFLFENLDAQADWLGVPHPDPGSIDGFLSHGDVVECSGVELDVLHTPGHTPGSLTFHLTDGREILFSGDTLFFRGIGRTDLWGGSLPDLMNSIQSRLLRFEDDTLVIPGHGPSTTIGRERRENPYLR